MTSRIPSLNNYNINDIITILQRLNMLNIPLNNEESNMQEQIINLFPIENSLLINPVTVEEIVPNISINLQDDLLQNNTIMLPINSSTTPSNEVHLPINSSLLNPYAEQFVPGNEAHLVEQENVPIQPIIQSVSPQIVEILRNYINTEILPLNVDDVDIFQSIFNITNPPGPSYDPNYLIEQFKDINLGISEIEYPYEESLVKIYVPTIITIDNPYFKRLIRSQIINFKDILKDKEAAIQIAYFIKTGEITPEVQPHHDELSGYNKKPLSEDCIKSLKYKDITETPIFKNIDESSTCSICQTPVKELMELNQELIVLECNDYFCKDCIFKWLEQYQNKCPNCNKVLSCKEEDPIPTLTRENIFENNYYKAAYFIIRYCSYYRQKQEIDVQRLEQLNELFIQQDGIISMNDCKLILEFNN